MSASRNRSVAESWNPGSCPTTQSMLDWLAAAWRRGRAKPEVRPAPASGKAHRADRLDGREACECKVGS
eukprot:CAMPEP_0206166960 /NCGR_PEP_ID=MMETSP1474-20131121/26165_1 /ASSEMBLY_ACC=CAM_ASM_001110 /TAXON_ID=97495 /ORGANISM="Imantonia sp., Strain RCC918" /LENGTH=68 /DNA_ID=CAMNT_0053571315 /DNA_START=193 /DNA_END=399 /DNA_ORIENTATION=+